MVRLMLMTLLVAMALGCGSNKVQTQAMSSKEPPQDKGVPPPPPGTKPQ